MSDQRPDVLPLDLDTSCPSNNQDETVQLRRDGDTLRRIRDRKKERTPTAIVSEAFTFLNDHQISIVDAVEEGSLKTDGDLHKELENLKCSNGEAIVVNSGSTFLVGDDKCLPQTECHLSKDSGFASLERHLHSDDMLSVEVYEDVDGSAIDKSSSLDLSRMDNGIDLPPSLEVESQLGGQIICENVMDLNCDKLTLNIDSEENNGCGSGDCLDVPDIIDNLFADAFTTDVESSTESEKERYDIICEAIDTLSSSNRNDNICESDPDTLILTNENKSYESGNNHDNVNFKSDNHKKADVGEAIEVNSNDRNQSEVENIQQYEVENIQQKETDTDLNYQDCEQLDEEDSNLVVTGDGRNVTTPVYHDLEINSSEIKEQEAAMIFNDINLDHSCKDKETSLIVSDLVNDIGKETEGTVEYGEVDMRKKPDVIPASPIKCDQKTFSGNGELKPSKTGLQLKANPSTELISDDSSDEDTGIYAESFRRSNWVRVSQDKRKQPTNTPLVPNSSPSLRLSGSTVVPPASSDTSASVPPTENGPVVSNQDEVLTDRSKLPLQRKLCHTRSDSVTTTASEQEFKTRYISRRKCLIQRADSQQEYHRLSARIYEEDKEVTLERTSDTEDLGLHLLDSHPTYITSVDAGSPAEKAGIVEGQILVTVNDFNVLLTDHNDIIKLIQDCKGPIRLGVASTDFQPIRDLQAPVIFGHMYKLGTNSLVRIWKKRYFVLRNDNCLYYYKGEQDLDPLGALPLAGYTISRHTDTSKDYCFKAEKYRARTYYFMTENRDQLTQWVATLTEAVSRSKQQKESSSFMSVSSHNVSLPALDIRKPECSGCLHKLSPSSRSWQRRYCLLKDACIYYYKDVNSFSALGVAHLHGYTVDVAGHAKKKNSFSLRPPDPKMREFCFVADNDTDKKRWVEAIIHSIQRWVPVEKTSEC